MKTTPQILILAFACLASGARSGDEAPAPQPLTAEERQQCIARLREIDQDVDAHNRRVEVLKALEAELDALRESLDKERAALNRRDAAQVKAHNAKVDKGDERIELHRRLVREHRELTADGERKEIQFKADCANRPAPQPAAPAASIPAAAVPAQSACGPGKGLKEFQRDLDQVMADLRADQKQREAVLDKVLEARAAALSWDKDKRLKVLTGVVMSPRFSAFEAEKQPLVMELLATAGSGMQGRKPLGDAEQCALLRRIAKTLPAIKAINARQYAFMAAEVNRAR